MQRRVADGPTEGWGTPKHYTDLQARQYSEQCYEQGCCLRSLQMLHHYFSVQYVIESFQKWLENIVAGAEVTSGVEGPYTSPGPSVLLTHPGGHSPLTLQAGGSPCYFRSLGMRESHSCL